PGISTGTCSGDWPLASVATSGRPPSSTAGHPWRHRMAAEADTLRTGVTARTGAAVLSTLQLMGEGVRLFVAACRQLRFRATDRQRLVAQLVRIGTDTAPIAA